MSDNPFKLNPKILNTDNHAKHVAFYNFCGLTSENYNLDYLNRIEVLLTDNQHIWFRNYLWEIAGQKAKETGERSASKLLQLQFRYDSSATAEMRSDALLHVILNKNL